MKSSFILRLRKLGLAAFAALAFSAIAQAGPGLQYWQSLHEPKDIASLTPKDQAVFVCGACKGVSEVSTAKPEDVVRLHTADGEVACPACKKKLKVLHKTRREEPVFRTEVVYVDENGAEIAHLAKKR